MYNDLTFISNKMRLEKELAGAVRFERTERGQARSLDYKSSALGPSAMLPIMVRAGGFEPPRRKIVSGFKDRRVYQFRHARITQNSGARSLAGECAAIFL